MTSSSAPLDRPPRAATLEMTRRRGAAFALAVGLAAGLAACSGGGAGEALPSNRPSPERTATATGEAATSPRPALSRETATAGKSETPRATATATRTAEPPPTQQPARTEQPPPTQQTTRTAEPPPAQQPTHTTEPAQTKTQTQTQNAESSASAVPVAATGGSGGYFMWLLLFVLIVGVFLVVMISRSRRRAAWDAQCSGLAGETRDVIAVRLPPVLAAEAAEERAQSWPPVRASLIDLSGRWGGLAASAPNYDRQVSADEVAVRLRELAPAIDAENRALADQGDWRRMRPKVDAILDALAASAAATASPSRT